MNHRLIALALLALTLVWTSPALGQSDRGAITGVVTDQTGAVVATAKVTATNLNTGEVREVTTSNEGNFTIPELKADPYRVTVEAQGFKSATFEDVRVAVQVTRTLDVTLEVGAISDVVTVTSDQAPVIQANAPVRQTNVTERQVKELPLLVSAETAGRTPLAFIFLDSNVTPAAGEGTNASNFRVSGGQGLGTEILIDGAATRRAQRGTFFSEVAPGPNAFQEFTISTSSFSAEFGSTSGGVVNFTFKSGGNEFHGEAYEIHRNRALNANSFVNNAQGLPRLFDLQHDFGFNIGGPVYLPRFGEGGPTHISLKNRTFFFFNYEGYRFNQTETVNLSVPTERMRVGDFSELLTDPDVLSQFPGGVQIYSPIARFDASGRPIGAAPGTRVAIPGNRIDQFRLPTGESIIDPVGLAILQNIPRPTRPGVFRNFSTSSTRPTTMNNAIFKIDQIINDAQRLSFSYSFRKSSNVQGGFPRFPRPLIAFGVWDQEFKSHFARLQHDWTFTPTLLNHFNAGFTRYDVVNANTTLGFNPFSLGIPGASVIGGAFPSV
ncbi:MAG TPA: carboxypeptidase-like regulatory domain-containing protein, partial [Pyrinomonadaceae bacterium]|nr:carboxypeptidase-like regulatory domain-containing protein [Pyrinomonadaceae bacterium]